MSLRFRFDPLSFGRSSSPSPSSPSPSAPAAAKVDDAATTKSSGQTPAPPPADVRDVQRPDLKRVLGVDTARSVDGVGASRILDVLGRDRFVDVPSVRVPGRVSWVNFELARALGFPVADGNVMTETLEKALLDKLAWRALKPGEQAGDRETLTLHADRYGGSGIGTNGGAGRAAFLPWGNLNIKGVGLTPLAVVDPKDFQHSHGGAPMREGLIEALWGEVGSNLFSGGSTRILAVIDVDDHTLWPDGGREKRALIIRATDQLRPAHLLEGWSGGRFTPDLFVRMATEQGVLVADAAGTPDLKATMNQLVQRHAQAAAEQWRWRVIHGAIRTGNMQIAGGQLDLATMSSQPRTTPIKTLGHGGDWGREHLDRTRELQLVFDAVRSQLSAADRRRLNADHVNVARTMDVAYDAALQRQVLDACGFKPGMAHDLATAAPGAVRELADAVLGLAAMQNGAKNLLADKQLVDDSVVDVFHLLGSLPESLAVGRLLDRGLCLELLRPNLIGSERAKAENERTLQRLVDSFVVAWPKVMAEARTRADAHYDSPTAMDLSVRRRAAFENRPLDGLYRAQLNDALTQAIDGWDATRDPRLFTEAVDHAASASMRSVESLLGAGRTRAVEGGVDLNLRAIAGVEYCVRALNDGKRRLVASLPMVAEGNGFRLPTMPGQPFLSKEMVEGLRYRFTTDGWQTTLEAEARVVDDHGKARVEFAAPANRSDVGVVEGVFHGTAGGDFWWKDGSSNFRGYAYAVPDQRELQAILAQSAA